MAGIPTWVNALDVPGTTLGIVLYGESKLLSPSSYADFDVDISQFAGIVTAISKCRYETFMVLPAEDLIIHNVRVTLLGANGFQHPRRVTLCVVGLGDESGDGKYSEYQSEEVQLVPEPYPHAWIGPNEEHDPERPREWGPGAVVIPNSEYDDFVDVTFTVEFLVGDVTPIEREKYRLIKDSTRVQTAEFKPAVSEAAPVDFHMYATPPPLGYTYNQYAKNRNDLRPRPMTASDFRDWSQLKRAPLGYVAKAAGLTAISIVELLLQYGSSFQQGADWVPVYADYEAAPGSYLWGFLVPNASQQLSKPQYYGPILHMTYVRFPDAVTAPNGYPLADGVIRGHMDIPTATGVERVWGNYVKDKRGVWLRNGGDPLPQYCEQRGSCRVVMMSAFPGRASVPGVAEEYYDDLHIGWNAGANSEEVHDGDVFVRCGINIKVGGVLGFYLEGERDSTAYSAMTHGFYFDTFGSSRRVGIMELGRLFSSMMDYAVEDIFKIERRGGVVSYLLNDVVIHTSGATSGGPLRVGTTLYCAGDGVY